MKSKFKILLFDNGSLRPESTLSLRRLAKNLSNQLNMIVEPISLLHSHKIDKNKLDGVPATIIRQRLRQAIENKEYCIILLPLFVGPSLAITSYLKELMKEASSLCPEMDIRLADPLFGKKIQDPDTDLVKILKDNINDKISDNDHLGPFKVALVDHGSPIKELALLRNSLAQKLDKHFSHKGIEIIACSMERRDGDFYSFNDPLLETINLRKSEILNENNKKCDFTLIVALIFLLPGRHAGKDGDIELILQNMFVNGRIRNYIKTSLIGDHPLIYNILSKRVISVLDSNF